MCNKRCKEKIKKENRRKKWRKRVGKFRLYAWRNQHEAREAGKALAEAEAELQMV